jgi:hypothetical protein
MPFPFVFQHFWLIAIIVHSINAAMYWLRCRPIVAARPELADPVMKLFVGFYVLGYAPWLVMGAGICFGGLSNCLSFFRPGDGNPFVLAFFATIFMIQILGLYWVVFRDGAEWIAQLPSVFRGQTANPFLTRLFACLGFVAFIMMFIVLCFLDLPVP